jgi:cellulose synthase/poly-beta-1,6-N-acetylglucosamine synthase-like glycosyltransferase
MNTRTAGEDKELEALLMRQQIFVDYFDDIHIYDEKTRQVDDFNRQRGRWASHQIRSLLNNFHYLPSAIINSQYDWIDKIIQWMLIPRVFMMVIIFFACAILPFVYFTMAIKWWLIALICGFAFALATPDALVDKNWDSDFLKLPFRTFKSLLRMAGINLPSIKLPHINLPDIKLPKIELPSIQLPKKN